MKNAKPEVPPKLTAFNYCVLFLDLLGQRNEFRDQGWLKPHESEEEKKAFQEKIKQTIGRVLQVQTRVHRMLSGVLEQNKNFPFRLSLTPEHQAVWDEMQKTRITTQTWSDGVASYVNLGDSEIKCQMNGIFGLFGLAGAECFQGLALRQPIRGAIDGSWGVEIRPGELYGPAVAHAYELESEVAQYPRIVVGEGVGNLLQAHISNQEKGVFADMDRTLAELCTRMLIRDVDGVLILHYLGDAFRESFTQEHHDGMYRDGLAFVTHELNRFKTAKDTKLAFRYGNLMHYFSNFQPSDFQRSPRTSTPATSSKAPGSSSDSGTSKE
jgi:hypothetical protein